MRRVTGRELGDVLADLTAELGYPGEIRYGMSDPSRARRAGGCAVGRGLVADAPEMLRAAPLTVMPNAALGADPRVLAADIPAGAKVTARAIAALYASWLDEPATGRRHHGVGGEAKTRCTATSAA